MCADGCEKDLHTDRTTRNVLVSSAINNTLMLDLERHAEVIQKEPLKDVSVCHFGLQLQTPSKSQHSTPLHCVSQI